MAAISYDSPFLNKERDWGNLNSWLMALLFTAVVHGAMSWMPTPPPLQHAGNNDWRIVSSVQFVDARQSDIPNNETEIPAAKPKPAEPQNKQAEQPPLLVDHRKPALKPEPVIEPSPQQQVVKQEVVEEPQTEERVADSSAKEAPTRERMDMSQLVNNLTASLVTQPAGMSQAEYRSQIIEMINANKSYPKTARRRGIEGGVEVSFVVADDGSVIDLECHGKAKVLSQSACDAIKKSLPFPAPQQSQLQLSFVMDYVLR